MARLLTRVNATWLMTRGVNALINGDETTPDCAPKDAPRRFVMLQQAISGYSDFNPDNDPHREHDFGAFEFLGERLFFKLDYYHPRRDTLSPDPANIELCRRVLTVMLAEEY